MNSYATQAELPTPTFIHGRNFQMPRGDDGEMVLSGKNVIQKINKNRSETCYQVETHFLVDGANLSQRTVW